MDTGSPGEKVGLAGQRKKQLSGTNVITQNCKRLLQRGGKQSIIHVIGKKCKQQQAHIQKETLKSNNRKYFDRNNSERLGVRKSDNLCNWRSLKNRLDNHVSVLLAWDRKMN